MFIALNSAVFTGTFAAASEIEGVRLYRSPDRTRVVLDLDSTVKHKMLTLDNPSRVVVDITNVT